LLSTVTRKQRTIFDAHHTQTLPGDMVRAEGAPPTGDPAVDEAYDGLGATYDLYWDVYERNSIDDAGLPLNGTVHFGQNYDNAFWDGQRMVFGDGDGQLFNRFTIAVDVIGHELTHGVTQDEAQLLYFFTPGALNESISDVFGSLVKQRALNQTADAADWLIGAGLFTANVHGVALRSMKAPGTAYDDPVLGKDPQPAHMRDFVFTFEDNGGVHINSGIPNHAFYLVATRLGGFAWEKAGLIWYETLRDPQLHAYSGFRSFARRTLANAGRLFGAGSPEQQAVQASWRDVGINVSPGIFGAAPKPRRKAPARRPAKTPRRARQPRKRTSHK
jgi:Zn-dependent metalloprotease